MEKLKVTIVSPHAFELNKKQIIEKRLSGGNE